jgi:outer membrane cobalamin receptor
MKSVFGRIARPRSVHVGRLALSCVALACANHAQAQATPKQNPSGLPTVMVTATRSPLNLKQVLADVTVLTRADIERQSFGALADLLRSQSCFEFVRNGGPGSSTSVYLRGANTQHTVVLIDGVRMDTQSGSGGASWQNIPHPLGANRAHRDRARRSQRGVRVRRDCRCGAGVHAQSGR